MDENGLYHGWLMPKMPETGIKWRDASDKCFTHYGLIKESIYENETPVYERMPQEIAKQGVNPELTMLARSTAGGRLRFKTDSKYIAIRVWWEVQYETPHQPSGGTSGFDLYLTEDGKCRYYKTLMPPTRAENRHKGYRQIVYFETEKMRDVTIYFPIANRVDRLEIGLEETAQLLPAEGYALDKPIVFYGSSITHGGCASRPGNTYEGHVSRILNMDQRNMGFSDSARGEISIAEYIASLDMCAFVYDYDHNAPTPEWLRNTHYPFYKVIRKAKPNIPIICISRPAFELKDIAEPGQREVETKERKAIILETMKRAKDEGDENIYFVDGSKLFEGEASDACTVDGLHPNDLGFYRMAQALIPVLKQALRLE